MNILIRNANLEDLKAVQDLNYQLFVHDSEFEKELNLDWPYKQGEEYFKNKIDEVEGVCFVAEIEGKVVGYLAGGIRAGEEWLIPQRSEIENMLVTEDFRKKGVGKKLIEAFVEWSKQRNISRIVVNAFYGNKEGISFYKKVRFAKYDVNLELKIS